MSGQNEYQYKFLEARPCSNYRQLFIKGRKIRARVILGLTVGEDARTPEEVARDFNIPVEAVREAIHYCEHHEDVIRADNEMETQKLRELWKRQPPLVPPDFQGEL
jgi:uncharacterized protein (DUF433 family)